MRHREHILDYVDRNISHLSELDNSDLEEDFEGNDDSDKNEDMDTPDESSDGERSDDFECKKTCIEMAETRYSRWGPDISTTVF